MFSAHICSSPGHTVPGEETESQARSKGATQSSTTNRPQELDIVNVDFEWFNFDPEVDFHGTKTLLRQLLDVDSPLFDISSLADLILSQPTIGSTVKVDGKETDAYALITALGLKSHAQHEGLKGVVGYLGEKLGPEVGAVLRGEGEGKDVGLVVSERLINMPHEVAAPLYGMLVDELDAAVEDGEPYNFTHFLILSRVYREVTPDPEVDSHQQPKSKKAKEAASSGKGELFFFHPEDEVLRRHAVGSATYEYTKEDEAVAESKRAFSEMGIRTEGFVMVLERNGFLEAVKSLKAAAEA